METELDLFSWILAGSLAAAFLATGAMQLTQPYEKVHERMAWAGDFPSSAVKLIGAAELLAADG